MKKNRRLNRGFGWLLMFIVIILIIIYYVVGIAIAESDMSPWLKYLFLK